VVGWLAVGDGLVFGRWLAETGAKIFSKLVFGRWLAENF